MRERDIIGIYDIPEPADETERDKLLRAMRGGPLKCYRTRTTVAGPVVECEIYPIWRTAPPGRERAAKHAKSRAAQVAINERYTRQRITRLINANFGAGDIWATLTYTPGQRPTGSEAAKQARRDLQNYIARLKRRRKRAGLPPIRYIYVTELAGEDGQPVHVHHHIVMDGALDMDAVEAAWGKGRVNVRRTVPDEAGLTGLAQYIGKGKRHYKRWGRSQNLKEPRQTVADHRITPRRAQKIARNRALAAELLAKTYKGTRLLDIEVRYSAYVAGAYIHATMRRVE